MSFAAKSAVPNNADTALRQPVLERAAEGGLTLFIAPAGYLLTDSLAAALADHGRSTLWLRLGPEDRDPAMFLTSFMASAQRLVPGVGVATLAQMRRQPGPTAGWPPLFAHLALELAEALPTSSAVVLEHIHYLNDTHSTLGLLCKYLLPALPDGVTCILTTDRRLPPASMPIHTVDRTANDLRLTNRAALVLAERAGGLPTASMRRAIALTDGRAVALVGLLAAGAALGPTFVQQAIDRARGTDDLLARIARVWLATADTNALQALALTMRLEYSHPALVRAALTGIVLPAGPWLQPLADSWTRVRHVWQAPLRTVLRARATPSSSALRRMADYLASQDATEQAVPLYFELGDTESAVGDVGQLVGSDTYTDAARLALAGLHGRRDCCRPRSRRHCPSRLCRSHYAVYSAPRYRWCLPQPAGGERAGRLAW